MVEGGYQFGFSGKEHAAAKYVAGHVANTDAGELLSLDVSSQFAKMPLYGLPRSASGNAHFLVVVAVASPAGKGIAEPEVAGLRNLVRDVGKGRGTLIRSHDKIKIVIVVPSRDGRRDDAAVLLHIIGQGQKALDHDRVGFDTGLLDGFWRGADRRRLRPEAAL